MSRRFSVLLAEPQPLLREKIAGVLARQTCIWCVTQVEDLTGLVQSARELQPDFILADFSIWREAETVPFLKRTSCSSCLVALVDADSSFYQRAVGRLGLDGMTEKGQVLDFVLAAIKSRTEYEPEKAN